MVTVPHARQKGSLSGRCVLSALLFLSHCAWFADLGPRKQERHPTGAGGESGREQWTAGEGGILDASGSSSIGGDSWNPSGGSAEQGGSSPSDAGVTGLSGQGGEAIGIPPEYPGVGLLKSSRGTACTGSLVGERAVLTAASCFPGASRGCTQIVPDKWTFALSDASGTTREFPVERVIPFPSAHGLDNDCRTEGVDPCSQDDAWIVDLRRGRDLALVALNRAESGEEPRAIAAPLRVVTNIEIPTTDGLSARVYLDADLDFRPGSTIAPRVVGFGSDAVTAGGDLILNWAEGRFDLGPFWNIGCEQVPRCGSAENLRNRCPAIPFTAPDFYEDRALRVLDVTENAWVSSFLAGSAGSPLLVTRGAPAGSLSTFRGDKLSIFGVLSDAEPTHRGGERAATYFAPTFLKDTGRWLESSLRELASSGDTGASSSPASCERCSMQSLEAAIAAPAPRPQPWLRLENVTSAVLEGERIQLYALGLNDALYESQGTRKGSPSTLSWTAWREIRSGDGLLGNLASVGRAEMVDLLALTTERGLRFFSIMSTGEVLDRAAPPTPEGGFSSPPAVVATPPNMAPGAGALDVFIRGSGAELLRLRYREGAWLPSQTIALSITSAPSAVVVKGQSSIEVFARSRDFRLEHWTITSDLAPEWSADDLGPIEGAPIAHSSDVGRLDLFRRDAEGALWHRKRLDERWSTECAIGSSLISDVQLASPVPGVIQAFGLTELGALVLLEAPTTP